MLVCFLSSRAMTAIGLATLLLGCAGGQGRRSGRPIHCTDVRTLRCSGDQCSENASWHQGQARIRECFRPLGVRAGSAFELAKGI